MNALKDLSWEKEDKKISSAQFKRKKSGNVSPAYRIESLLL